MLASQLRTRVRTDKLGDQMQPQAQPYEPVSHVGIEVVDMRHGVLAQRPHLLHKGLGFGATIIEAISPLQGVGIRVEKPV